MKQIKVSEATPIQLDWLVAKCEGRNFVHGAYEYSTVDERVWASGISPVERRYSTDWAHGGPIIERECIATYASGACSVPPKNPDYWVAEILATDEMFTQFGPTPLIAMCRCYVASKLGVVVEVPEELG